MKGLTLQISDLGYVVRGRTLLEGISLASAAGQCTALLGANGAGKTTLLRLCHGLIQPSQGKVRWGDLKPRELGRRIAMVFQKPCLLRRSTRENLDYVLRLHRVLRAERQRRVDEVFALARLGHCADQPAWSLSGGEQQRLVIARACVLEPDIVLLDEPTARLDMESTVMVEQIICRLKERGVKIILVSHNFLQVKKLCDEVVFLEHGQLVTHTDRDSFFSGRDERTRDFIRMQAFF